VRKATRNYILALIMALLALFQAVSGFVLWLALPAGYMGGRGTDSTFLWSRGIWLNLHNWTAVALVVIVLVHVILHWGWVVRMTRSYFSQKSWSGGSNG
jgi:ABC-type dipeptide/oligopeptide/nickel transport system permease subunit